MSNMLGRPYRPVCSFGCCRRFFSRKTGLGRMRQREKRFWRKDQGCD